MAATSVLFSRTLTSPSKPLCNEGDFAREILELDEHRRQLVAQRNALYAPISRLPGEVLVLVFHFASSASLRNFSTYSCLYSRLGLTESSMSGTGQNEGADPRHLFPVLLVCRRWHEIAMRHPSLWAAVGSGRLGWSKCAARALMERSKNALMSFTLHNRALRRRGIVRSHCGTILARRNKYDRPNEVDEVRNMLQQAARIAHLDLELDGPTYSVFAEETFSRTEWRALRSAKLMAYANSEFILPLILPIARAESLRSLILQGLSLDRDGSCYAFPALEDFSLSNGNRNAPTTSLSSIIAFLSNTPRLVRLELEGSQQEHRSDVDPSCMAPANLSHLLYFNLQGPEGSDVFTAGKYVTLQPECAASYFLTPSASYVQGIFPPSSTTATSNLSEILPRSLPFRVDSLLPHYMKLAASSQYHGQGVQMNAEYGDDEHTATVRRLRSLRFDFIVNSPPPNSWHPPGEPATPDQINAQVEEWKRARGADIESLLAHSGSLTALRTFECTLVIPPDSWIRILSSCYALECVRLSGLDTARSFTGAIVLSTLNAMESDSDFLRSLQHLEMDAITSEWWLSLPYAVVSPNPPFQAASTWASTLHDLAGALPAPGGAGDKLQSLTLHRGFVGITMTMMSVPDEAEAIVKLGEVFDELIFD